MTKEIDKYIKEVELPVKHIFKDMLKYAPSKIFGLIGNAVIVPVYTNLLTPSEYGLYTISLAVLSFLCILFSDWIGLAGLRFFRQNQLNNQIPKYLSTLVLILISNLTVMYVLCFIFRHKFYEYFNISPKAFIFLLILIIPVALRALLFQVLRAQIKPGSFTVSTIINQVLTIVFAVLIIKYLHLGAMSILLGMSISITIIDIMLIFQTDILSYLRSELPNLKMIKTLFVYGIPISVASISLWVINQSNKFITTHYHGLEHAGFVGVAYNMTFPLLMTLFAIITIAAYPRIINLYEDKIDVRPVISRMTGYFLMISVPVVVIICVYAKDVLYLFANHQYLDAYIILPYFALSALFLSLTDYTTIQYHLANRTYILTMLKILSATVGLVLNIFLIKKFGLTGAGIAVLSSNILYFILTVIVTLPDLEWKIPYKKISHISICFIPSAIIWYFLQKTQIMPILQINILLFSYYFVFYLTRKFFKEVLS